MHRTLRLVQLLFSAVFLISALAPVAVAAPQDNSRIFLPVVRTGGQAPQPTRPTSADLIQKALDAGQLDADTALLYKVYAAFGDSRLPAAYRGDDTLVEDSHVMAEVAERYSVLPPDIQAAVAPFRLPPTAPGSWYATHGTLGVAGASPDGEWQVMDTANGKARVWYSPIYQGEAQKAATVAAAIDAKIWPGLQDLMKREPLSDVGAPHDGGDGRLDIYLVRDIGNMGESASIRGLTVPNTDCESTSAWILINSGRDVGSDTKAGILQTVSHEMMHAWQFSYLNAAACNSYTWLAEATAKWTEDYLYPQAQSEQPYAPAYLNTAYWPLETVHGVRHYGAYLFFFFATHSKDRPSIIRRVWEESQSYDSLKATEQAAGPLSTTWHDFALFNLNRYPVDSYQQWDALTAQARPHGDVVEVKLNGGTDMAYMGTTVLEHLSMQYQHYKFIDPGVRSVTFFNGLTYKLSKIKRNGSEFYNTETLPYELTRGAKVQALIKIENQPWQVADWTYERSKFFCRDERAGRLEELILIQSYSEHENPTYKMQPAGLESTLYVTNVGCWRYQGSVTWQGQRVTPDENSSEQGSVTNVIWERVPGMFGANESPIGFNVIQGNLSFSSSHSSLHCQRQASANFALKPEDSTSLIIQRWATSGPEWRAYDAWGNSTGDLVEHSACPDPEESTGPFGVWWETEDGATQVRADGTLYQSGLGHGWGDTDMDRTWTWTFTPLREP